MKLNIPNGVISQQDLKSLINDIQKYSKWFAEASIKMRYDKNNTGDQPAISDGASELINEWAGDEQLTQNKLEDLINTLLDYADEAPYLTITLAAPASRKIRQELVDWCRKNIDSELLVNFKFNATILGGMVITYGSHIYDWSFRRKILANRQKFAEYLRHV